jgi:hypothetical protein
MTFRFEEFADAASARAAFEAAFAVGSPAEAALQALVDMGAQCKTAGTGRIACRYVENRSLAGWCWHVAIEAGTDKAILRLGVAQAMLGT